MSVKAWGQLFVQLTAPAEDPVMVGSLWSDTTASLLKRCTAIAPYTWVSTEGGSSVTPAALTKVDDTNVTLTLGGTPATALLQASSITVGWTGVLGVARGGIGIGTLAAHGVLVGAGTAQVAATGTGTAGQQLVSGGASADPSFKTPFGSSGTPTDPTGTSSTAGVMMGLGGSFTPATTGRMLLFISGDAWNSTAASGFVVALRFGTGSAPANAAALTGTQAGNPIACPATTSQVNDRSPYAIMAIVSGLTVGTPYWLDAALTSITSGTSTIQRNTLGAIEF